MIAMTEAFLAQPKKTEMPYGLWRSPMTILVTRSEKVVRIRNSETDEDAL